PRRHALVHRAGDQHQRRIAGAVAHVLVRVHRQQLLHAGLGARVAHFDDLVGAVLGREQAHRVEDARLHDHRAEGPGVGGIRAAGEDAAHAPAEAAGVRRVAVTPPGQFPGAGDVVLDATLLVRAAAGDAPGIAVLATAAHVAVGQHVAGLRPLQQHREEDRLADHAVAAVAMHTVVSMSVHTLVT